VLVVNDAGRTRRPLAKKAVEELERVHVNLLGVVLNRLSPRSKGYYYYYRYYRTQEGEKRRRRKRAL
jgi:Mrp family chromosome partitioning ATPase